MPNSLKNSFLKLPLTKKLILISSFAAVIGVFLPWYHDIDKFKVGDMFLGINGPLYLAGLIILVSAIFSSALLVMKLMNKPLPKLPLKENHFYIFTSALSILMIVLTASVYFHPKFGINLTEKSAGSGMIITLIAMILTMVSALVAMKQKTGSIENEGHLEPLIDMNDRVKNEVRFDNQKQEIKTAVQESIDEFTSGVNNQ